MRRHAIAVIAIAFECILIEVNDDVRVKPVGGPIEKLDGVKARVHAGVVVLAPHLRPSLGDGRQYAEAALSVGQINWGTSRALQLRQVRA